MNHLKEDIRSEEGMLHMRDQEAHQTIHHRGIKTSDKCFFNGKWEPENKQNCSKPGLVNFEIVLIRSTDNFLVSTSNENIAVWCGS